MTDRPLPKISNPQIKSVGAPRSVTDTNFNAAWSPPPINTLADTGLNLLSVADLVLKVLYFGGYMAGHQVADIIKLPFTGVVDTVMVPSGVTTLPLTVAPAPVLLPWDGVTAVQVNCVDVFCPEHPVRVQVPAPEPVLTTVSVSGTLK